MQAKIEECRKEIEQLKKRIEGLRDDKEQPFLSASRAAAAIPPVVSHNIALRRKLKGHFGKVYALSWGKSENNANNLVSASQDGRLLIWNTKFSTKINAITLKSAWVMAVEYSPSGNLVACGGLDNICSFFRVNDEKSGGPVKELYGHEGYLSNCKFLSEDRVITSSGDSTAMLWDVNTSQCLATFADHQGDVMSLALCNNNNMFLSASCDATCKLWDLRIPRSVANYQGHESDVNCVVMFPDKHAFGTASDDSQCALWDLRSLGCLNRFASEKISCGISSLDFSSSGRLLFAGYDDNQVLVWDSVKAVQVPGPLHSHGHRVSCLAVDSSGFAIATGSWDTHLHVWA